MHFHCKFSMFSFLQGWIPFLILNSSVSMGIFCQYSQDDNVLSVSSGCNDLHLAQISAGHAKKAPPATQSLGLSEECMYLSQCSSGKKKKLKWRSKTNLLFYICIIPDQYNSNKKISEVTDIIQLLEELGLLKTLKFPSCPQRQGATVHVTCGWHKARCATNTKTGFRKLSTTVGL